MLPCSVTSPKLRFFSAAVSPYLFRYAPFHRFRLKFASVTWRKFENQGAMGNPIE
ncbi:hypothetical protein ASPWEDRAFT_35573 [Aspergillus wentii DTO 134E9]|uniref:Uncharacterized protein n=1 Tax=Aspergillus wentii DTO 134E9 TaxID=1073089 RepID=A0A1L9S455_ASPWE|nr:uncharacterized protein ASPWEDRAFT_35573 [Aspergillus wentii DTO 134E9]OJJ41948.1 hypothetical protein ASPWEDRAFT_35573 [Aspergillus wentii DTO 134E9]